MIYVGLRVNDNRDIGLGFSYSIDKYDDHEGSRFEQVISNGYNYATTDEAHRAAVDWLNENHSVYWDFV